MIDLSTCCLALSAHVVERWGERVRAGSPSEAIGALEGFCRSGYVEDAPPDWAFPIDDGIVIANTVVPDVLVVAHQADYGLKLVTVISARDSSRATAPGRAPKVPEDRRMRRRKDRIRLRQMRTAGRA